jgi:hypothetical protein
VNDISESEDLSGVKAACKNHKLQVLEYKKINLGWYYLFKNQICMKKYFH